jgi:hypothetical protein
VDWPDSAYRIVTAVPAGRAAMASESASQPFRNGALSCFTETESKSSNTSIAMLRL